MPRYIVTLTENKIQELKALVQKDGKGGRIRHTQILLKLKLNQKPENETWTYDRIKNVYGAGRGGLYYRQYHLQSYEKNKIKPWLVKEWCIPKADAGFVAKLEDVPEFYRRPYTPPNPVVCIDETNKTANKRNPYPL